MSIFRLAQSCIKRINVCYLLCRWDINSRVCKSSLSVIADGDFYYKRKAVYGDMTRIFYHIKDDIRKGILDRIV